MQLPAACCRRHLINSPDPRPAAKLSTTTVNMLLSDIAGLLLHVACWFLALDLFSFQTGNIEHLRLLDAPLDELRAGLDSGLFTSVDLVRANIAQVEEVNPLVHAVNEMNPEIVFTAAAGKANVSQRLGLRGTNVTHDSSAYGGDAIGANSSDGEPSGQSLGSEVASSVGLCWVCLRAETRG